MANFSKQSTNITWVSDAGTARKRATKNNPMDRKTRMIDPAGFVVEVSLSTGRGIPFVHNLYAPHILAKKLAAGFVEYDSFGDPTKEIKKREDFIAARQAAHTEKQNEYAGQHMTEGQMMAKAVLKMSELAEQNGGNGKG
jgi:hypothetical protein